MLLLDDGLLEIYTKIPIESTAKYTLDPYAEMYYSDINFFSDEYYSSDQENTEIMRRVRVLQDKGICNRHIVVVEGEQYEVGRVWNGKERGMLITDITLTRVTNKYEVKGDAS